MSRKYEPDYINDDVVNLLNKLADVITAPEEYKAAMYDIGKLFGKIIIQKIPNINSVSLASTVEDADYLSKGIIDELEKAGKKVFLTVFWNKRFTPNEENRISISPIIKEFHQPGYDNVNLLIIVKSIIASSCIVRTNLTRLIETFKPEKIFVVAPVLLKGAQKNLESEFEANISKLFEYLFFAIDDEKNSEGLVMPGIGGDVYKRLGFKNQEDKNIFTPSIVTQRRYANV